MCSDNHKSDVSCECQVCQKDLCDYCVKSIDQHNFCETHYNEVSNKQFESLEHVIVDPDNPTQGLELYQKQKNLLNKGITTYIEVRYKESNAQILSEYHLMGVKE